MATHPNIDPLQHLSFTASRRLEVRYNLPSISYVQVDEDNGGVVLNICEGGVSLQAVHPLADNRFLRLKFKLPGSGIWVKVNGQVVWLSQTKTHAGICFVDLPDTVRAEIRDWVSSVTSARKPGEAVPRASAAERRIQAYMPGTQRRRMSDTAQPLRFPEVITPSLQEPNGRESGWFGKLLSKIYSPR